MAKLKKVFLAALLTTVAILSAPKTSLAINFCKSCALTQDCMACCICAGNSFYDCVRGGC
jgi:hypothetical protein